MSKKCTFIETENRPVFAWGWRWEWELTLNKLEGILGGMKMFKKWIVWYLYDSVKLLISLNCVFSYKGLNLWCVTYILSCKQKKVKQEEENKTMLQ